MKKFKLGYLGNGAIYRSTKDSIFTFVNNRMVKSKIVESAVIGDEGERFFKIVMNFEEAIKNMGGD